MQPITKIKFYFRANNTKAKKWKLKIERWLKEKHPKIKIVDKNPQAIIAMGGDGTILEAARECIIPDALLVGLNLGQVGFLATIREEKNFYPALNKILQGKYKISERMMLEIKVIRKKKMIFNTNALNEAIVLDPIGLVELDVYADNFQLQRIKGTGIVVSTPTGSTAFNLSAHGPVMVPENKGIIVTEMFDHNIPTPSIILNPEQKVILKIIHFRKKNLLEISKTKKPSNVLLSADGAGIFPLETGDMVEIKQSSNVAKLCELEKNYFLKSFQEKFDFK